MADIFAKLQAGLEWADQFGNGSIATSVIRGLLDQRTATAVQMPADEMKLAALLRAHREAKSFGETVSTARAVLDFTEEHGHARAEEARREVLEQTRDQCECLHRQNSELETALAALHAQRTAGGDAVAAAMDEEGGYDRGADVPVAEAAAQADGARTKLKEMRNEDNEIGWYFDCDGHYIDVERDEDGKYSIYFRNRKDQSEAWLDQSDAAPTAQPTPQHQTGETHGQVLPATARGDAQTDVTRPASGSADAQADGRTAEAVAQPTPPDDERASPTFMDERQAQDWAWKAVRKDCDDGTWTTGETGNYFGFFLHGWRYREQYEKQRRAALRQPGALPDEAELRYTLDEIAHACMMAEVSDSRFEAMGIYLAAAKQAGKEA